MSYRGFDVGQIRSLAGDLTTLGDGSPTLHQDISDVLNKAHTAMATGPATYDGDLEKVRTAAITDAVFDALPFGGTGTLPMALNDDLNNMSDEMKRRCDQLDGVKELDDAGYPVSSCDLFLDDDPPSQQDIDEAVRFFDDLDEGDFNGVGGREALLDAMGDLEGLSPAELNIVMSKVPPEQLEEYNDILNQPQMFNLTGITYEERTAHLSDLLADVGSSNLDKFVDAFPGVQPSFDNGEHLDGSEEWGTTGDPLFSTPNADGLSVDVKDINQGSFGDCWYLASLASLAQANPQFIQDGIRENDNGTVSVRIWDAEGNMQWVTVTADLPLDENGDPVGAYGDGESWPAYYEKAFAQTFDEDPRGTYGAIEGGWSEDAVPHLTGGEAEDIGGGWFGSDYDNVKDAFSNGRAVTVSSTGEDPPEGWKGYTDNHAYYVVGVKENGNILIGNPWGQTDYPPIECTPDEFEEYFEDPQATDVPS